MFKLVVLFAFVAVASAGYAPLAYTHYAAPAVSVPTAVSHQSRTDVISKPIVATYAAAPVATYAAAPVATYAAAPVATYAAAPVATYAAAPVAAHVSYSAPAVAVPTAVSHQSRTDVISKPVVAAYSAPVAVDYGYAGYAAAPLGYGYGYAGKLAYGHY